MDQSSRSPTIIILPFLCYAVTRDGNRYTVNMRVFRISYYWTTFHHQLGAWNRLMRIISVISLKNTKWMTQRMFPTFIDHHRCLNVYLTDNQTRNLMNSSRQQIIQYCKPPFGNLPENRYRLGSENASERDLHGIIFTLDMNDQCREGYIVT